MGEVSFEFHGMDQAPPHGMEVLVIRILPQFKKPRIRVAGYFKGVFYEITTEEQIPDGEIVAWARIPKEVPRVTLH